MAGSDAAFLSQEALIARIRLLDLSDLVGVGACRLVELRETLQVLVAARSKALDVTDRQVLQDKQAEAEREALYRLSGPGWASDAIAYAPHHPVIGPALQALDDTVLAALAAPAIDQDTFETLTAAWRQAIPAE